MLQMKVISAITYTIKIISTGIGSNKEDITIMRFDLDVTKVTIQLSPWLCSAIILEHIAIS